MQTPAATRRRVQWRGKDPIRLGSDVQCRESDFSYFSYQSVAAVSAIGISLLMVLERAPRPRKAMQFPIPSRIPLRANTQARGIHDIAPRRTAWLGAGLARRERGRGCSRADRLLRGQSCTKSLL